MKAIFSLFLDWKVKLCIILVLLSSLYFWHVSELKIAVNKAELQLVQKYNKELTILEDKAKHSNFLFEEKIKKQRKNYETKIYTNSIDYNNLLNSLSNRPERSNKTNISTSTDSTSTSDHATGLQLYRADAQFLAWFSNQTTQLQLEMNTCHEAYASVKKNLDEFRK